MPDLAHMVGGVALLVIALSALLKLALYDRKADAYPRGSAMSQALLLVVVTYAGMRAIQLLHGKAAIDEGGALGAIIFAGYFVWKAVELLMQRRCERLRLLLRKRWPTPARDYPAVAYRRMFTRAAA